MIKFQSLPRQQRRELRDEVLRLYAETELTQSEIAKKNGMSIRTVQYIIRNFAGKNSSFTRNAMKESELQNYEALRAENARLRKDLHFQTMRADVFGELVRIAEEEMHIPLRKKGGAKQ